MKSEPRIYPVTCHTDHVGVGTTFVAIRGFSSDGSDYIDLAIEKGAQTIIVEKCKGSCRHSTRICENQDIIDFQKTSAEYEFVPDARKELAQRSARSLGNPAKKLSIIGVTGTKGKTTVVHLLAHILTKAGYKTASASTNSLRIGEQETPAVQTTLGSDGLHMFFHDCISQGITHVVLEVSSHALVLDRIWGIELAAACITNIGEDHIDFHKTRENYVQAKMSIQDYLAKQAPCIIYNDMILSTWASLSCPSLPAGFNRKNMALAAEVSSLLGIEKKVIEKGCRSFAGVSGRMQKHLLANGAVAFIDYAHNAFALEVVLKELRGMTSDLIVVFGCGGGRDTTRRFSMGRVASLYADKIILTNDNPRLEDPLAIVDDICSGISPEKMSIVSIETDRSAAIALAATYATKDSIILVAGKGHERSIMIGNKVVHIDDLQEVSRY